MNYVKKNYTKIILINGECATISNILIELVFPCQQKIFILHKPTILLLKLHKVRYLGNIIWKIFTIKEKCNYIVTEISYEKYIF